MALVSFAGRPTSASEILATLDSELTFLESVEEVGEARPSLFVLCVAGTLASAVANELAELRPVAGQAPILIVCPRIRPGELRAALAAGAAGVVLEDELEDTLIASVQAVKAGQACVPRRHSQQIEPAALSAREKQILGLVVLSYSNAQIAEQLYLAESTVKSHLSSAFVKLGVKSRNEAVDLILDPERGFGVGILGLGSEQIELEQGPIR